MTGAEIAALEAEIAIVLDDATRPTDERLRVAATRAIRGYGPQILGYLVRVLRDEQAGREVFSAFCEDLWRGMAGFRRECPLRVWAYRLALNAARRHGKDPFVVRGRRLATEEQAALQASVHSVTSEFRQRVERRAVERFRESLDLEDQTLLTLRVDKELSWREVAEVMGEAGETLDEAALRKRFERIKDALRTMARKGGLR